MKSWSCFFLPSSLYDQKTVHSRGSQSNVQSLQKVAATTGSDFFQVRFALFNTESMKDWLFRTFKKK